LVVTASIKVPIPGGGSVESTGTFTGKSGPSGAGGAGSILTGTSKSSFINEGEISAIGGFTLDPMGFFSRGNDGVIYIMAENASLGNIAGTFFVDTIGESDPGNIFFDGGVGGGGGGAAGVPIPEPPAWATMIFGLAGLVVALRRRRRHA
jgi:MYXO-CTERM domain-containing protein